jgi:hypothetical protein
MAAQTVKCCGGAIVTQLVTCFPPRGHGFDPTSGDARFVLKRMTLVQFLYEYLDFPCQSSFRHPLFNLFFIRLYSPFVGPWSLFQFS